MRRKRNYINILLLLLVALSTNAQDTVSYTVPSDYGFIKLQDNILHNSTALAGFYEKLYQLKKLKTKQVNIVQIGDSHIQADFLSSITRQLLQKEFGNAGRGLIFPGRIARTNEPQNTYSSSSANWEAKRIVFMDQPLPIGINATVIKTSQVNARFAIRTLNGPLNYSFNKITLFFQKDFTSFNLAVRDSVGQDLAFLGPYTLESFPNTSTIQLPFNTNQVEFQTLQPTPTQMQLTLFGMNLENGKPGVLYHAIGGNGAKFKHYLSALYFAEQTAALYPDLFIISLGTNEAIEYPYSDPQFTDQMDTLIARLRNMNPNALFLLTIPADFFKKKTRRNPGVEVTRDKIIKYADQKNIAYWDLYEIGGGKHSADNWKKKGLMQFDGIHFTKSGYELQGSLLYDALTKGYNEYVLYRYP